MFLVELTYVKAFKEIDNHLEAHKIFLQDLYEKKLIVFSGPKVPRTGGVILFKSIEYCDIIKIIDNDPFKINSLAIYNIIEFNPNKCDELFCFN